MNNTTAKTGKRPPAEKALNQNLADKKAQFEETGWSFNHDKDLGWEGAKDGHKLGHFPKLGELLEDIEKMASIEERFAPKFITEENRIPDNTEIVFDDDGTEREGYIFSTSVDQKQYLVKVAISNDVYDYFLKPGEFQVKNPQAEKSNVVAGDFQKKDETAEEISAEDKALDILLKHYFSKSEINEARKMSVSDAKKYLSREASASLRGSANGKYTIFTNDKKIKITVGEATPVEFTIAAIASKIVESWKTESAIGGFGDEKTLAEGESKPPTLEQAATLSDLIGRGWHIAKNNSGDWEGYKEIDGKKVECKNADLDKLFGQIEELDPKPAPVKTKPSETLPTSEIKKVRFELTDDDIKLKTNALMENFRTVGKKTADFAEIKKLYKKDIEALDKEKGDLINQIDSRVEFRPVECSIEYDLERGEAIYYRPDNGEQVDRRSMTKDELKLVVAAAERAKQRPLF